MFNNTFVVASTEFNRLRKSFFFWVGLVLISLAPELINNPIADGRVLCTASSVAYYILYSASITDEIAIALLIGYISFYDDKTEINSVILTQPINTYSYALGRFLAVFFTWLFLAMIRVAILMCVPLYFKAAPYSPMPFLQGTLIYLLPTMFYFTAVSYLILMLSKSPIITIIISIVLEFTHLALLKNTLVDLNLEGKVQIFTYGGKLPHAFQNYFITNRIFLILLGILFLTAAILIFSPIKNNTRREKKSKALKFKLNYNFRIQSPVIRSAVLLIALVCISFISVPRGLEAWYPIKMVICMIPLFFIVNVLSDEYVQKRDGILFTCKVPIYKQMLVRILYGWLFSEGIIFICYLVAFFRGYESDFNRLLTMIVISTFLGFIGLTASNLSKKPLIGFIVPVAYFAYFAFQGAMFNEEFSLISVINLMLSSQIVWVNILGLMIGTIILLIFNIWYVGKGEMIRKPLLKATACTFIVVCATVGTYSYYSYNKNSIQSKILNNRDTVYVLASKNIEAERFLDIRGIKYISKGKFEPDDFSKNNVVVIGDKNYHSEKLLGNIKLNRYGLQINDFNIVDTTCFRFTTVNPSNIKKNIVFMESKNWSKGELNLLFNERTGNFLAAKGELCLVKSNYNLRNAYSMVDNLKMCYQGTWFMKKKEDVKVMYRDIPMAKVKIDDLLDVWYITHKEINKMVANNSTDTMQVYFRNKSKENLSSKALQIEVNDRRSFDPPKSDNDSSWVESITTSALDNIVLKNIQDEDMRTKWGEYLFSTRMMSAFKGLDKEILGYKYTFTNGNVTECYENSYESFKEDMERVKKNIYLNRDNIGVAGENILYSFDDKRDSLNKIINEVYKSDTPIDEAKLKEMFLESYDINNTQSVFNFYDKVKEACDKYGGLGLMLKPVNQPPN